ncbi:MAG: hypothetical protein MUF54_10700, partial [Polyangiaceae bacterium]|nr:hypothetical protein [Polyangiaceae bacterium]
MLNGADAACGPGAAARPKPLPGAATRLRARHKLGRNIPTPCICDKLACTPDELSSTCHPMAVTIGPR